MNDFSKRTIANLAKKGITILGKQAVPGVDGSWANAGTAYRLDDRGCVIVRTFQQVRDLAE